MDIFSTNLRLIRKKKKLSQEEFAAMCDLHRTYIGAIERSERNISIKNIEKIANALEIKPYELLKDSTNEH